MSKKSICVLASTCGGFNYCTNEDFDACRGAIEPLLGNKKFSTLLPDFHIGRCSHCGTPGVKVAEVNSNFNQACESCWQTIFQHRTLEELIEEKEKRKKRKKYNKQNITFCPMVKMAWG